MAYAVGDRVQVGAARGGWIGYVIAIAGGPLYVVRSEHWEDPYEGTQVVAPTDITAGPLSLPAWESGDVVTLAGRRGTIVAAAPPSYSVDVEVQIAKHLTVTRRHEVLAHQLAAENHL